MSRLDTIPPATFKEFANLCGGHVDFSFPDPRDYEEMVKWCVGKFGRGYYFGPRPTPMFQKVRSINTCQWCLAWVLAPGAPREKMIGRFFFRHLNDALIFKLTWAGQ